MKRDKSGWRERRVEREREEWSAIREVAVERHLHTTTTTTTTKNTTTTKISNKKN